MVSRAKAPGAHVAQPRICTDGHGEGSVGASIQAEGPGAWAGRPGTHSLGHSRAGTLAEGDSDHSFTALVLQDGHLGMDLAGIWAGDRQC